MLISIGIPDARRPPTGVKIPKIGKEGFGVQKLPFPIASEKGVRVKKSPFLHSTPQGKWGIFLTRNALFWGDGKWEFLDPETLFPDFGDFDSCQEPLNAPFLNGLFSSGFSRGKTAP